MGIRTRKKEKKGRNIKGDRRRTQKKTRNLHEAFGRLLIRRFE